MMDASPRRSAAATPKWTTDRTRAPLPFSTWMSTSSPSPPIRVWTVASAADERGDSAGAPHASGPPSTPRSPLSDHVAVGEAENGWITQGSQDVRVQHDAVRVSARLRRAHRTPSTGTPSRSATSPEIRNAPGRPAAARCTDSGPQVLDVASHASSSQAAATAGAALIRSSSSAGRQDFMRVGRAIECSERRDRLRATGRGGRRARA